MGLSLISGCTLRLMEWCLAHLRREVKSVKMLGGCEEEVEVTLPRRQMKMGSPTAASVWALIILKMGWWTAASFLFCLSVILFSYCFGLWISWKS